MDFYLDILRLVAHLVASLLWAAYEHPFTGAVAAFVWDAMLTALAGAAMYVLTERVFKRIVPPTPSPAEDAERMREERETARRRTESRDVVSPRRRRMMGRRRGGP